MTKVLFISFIDLDGDLRSGSSMRPVKMLQAFRELGVEVAVLDGMNNDLRLRKKNIAALREKLKTWRPDLCYIEPPSGPMFYRGDLKLIRDLHREKIPMALFYRDAYWKYPEYYLDKNSPFIDKLKHRVIRRMQLRQWKLFEKNIDKIYFPSLTMAKIFEHKDTLPPGTFHAKASPKKEIGQPLQFLFVGGAHRNHGTHLTIDAFARANRDRVIAKLFYICPREQWAAVNINEKDYADWLEVIHASGDEELQPYYERADVALLTAPRTFYRDFAVPTKIYEYISYLRPALVTDCTETARIIEENGVGWVVKDNVDSVCGKLQELCTDSRQIRQAADATEKAREDNLWTKRAEQVVRDLGEIGTQQK